MASIVNKKLQVARGTVRKDPTPKNPNDGLAQNQKAVQAGKGDKGKMPSDSGQRSGKGDRKVAAAPKPKARPAAAAAPKPTARPASLSKGPASGTMTYTAPKAAPAKKTAYQRQMAIAKAKRPY